MDEVDLRSMEWVVPSCEFCKSALQLDQLVEVKRFQPLGRKDDKTPTPEDIEKWKEIYPDMDDQGYVTNIEYPDLSCECGAKYYYYKVIAYADYSIPVEIRIIHNFSLEMGKYCPEDKSFDTLNPWAKLGYIVFTRPMLSDIIKDVDLWEDEWKLEVTRLDDGIKALRIGNLPEGMFFHMMWCGNTAHLAVTPDGSILKIEPGHDYIIPFSYSDIPSINPVEEPWELDVRRLEDGSEIVELNELPECITLLMVREEDRVYVITDDY